MCIGIFMGRFKMLPLSPPDVCRNNLQIVVVVFIFLGASGVAIPAWPLAHNIEQRTRSVSLISVMCKGPVIRGNFLERVSRYYVFLSSVNIILIILLTSIYGSCLLKYQMFIIYILHVCFLFCVRPTGRVDAPV